MKAFSSPAGPRRVRVPSCETAGDNEGDDAPFFDLVAQTSNHNPEFAASVIVTPAEEDPFIPARPRSPPAGSSSGDVSDDLSNARRTHWRLLRREAHHDGGGRRLESATAPKKTPSASSSTSRSSAPNRYYYQGVELVEEDGTSSNTDARSRGNSLVGGLGVPHDETLLMVPAGLGAEEAEDAEVDDVAAADWLDVATALLDAGNGAGDACSG